MCGLFFAWEGVNGLNRGEGKVGPRSQETLPALGVSVIICFVYWWKDIVSPVHLRPWI